MNELIIKMRDIRYQKKTIAILDQVQKILDSYDTELTVRQIFYRLVALGYVKNTKAAYRKVSSTVSNGRYTGHIGWDRIIDETRGVYKTDSYASMRDALEDRIDEFRYDRWENSPYYLEVWVEKRTLISILRPIVDEYDLRFAYNSGYDSTTEIGWAAMRFILNKDKKRIILYFGDCDPSGHDMTRDIRQRLNEFPKCDVQVIKILLNREQVDKYSLPKSFEVSAKKQDGTIYDKLMADPRAQRFFDEHGELFQVEVESLDPRLLPVLVRESIEPYLPDDYADILAAEEEVKKKARGRVGVWQE